MPRIANQSIARRLRFLAVINFLLACGAFIIVRSQESEPWSHAETHVHETVRTTISTTWPVAITMAIALTWALLEFAQLVLLLITDEEAVRICYEQNYSAAQMKDEGERARMKQKHRSHDDREKIPELRTERKEEKVKSDQISTNIPVTPSQLSDDSDAEETKSKCRGPAHIETSSPDNPICGCEEEDYLVAMEDDIRRPCHTEPMNPATKRPLPTLTHSGEKHESDHGQRSPLKQASVTEPKKAGASSATPDTAHGKEEAEHHFKDDLLPAADETLMDAL